MHLLKNARMMSRSALKLFSGHHISKFRARWKSLKPNNRHWLINIFIGIGIELVLCVAPLETVENMAMDRMMRVHAFVDPAPPHGRRPPRQLYVNVDDALWRDRAWGGGEPYRAPRAPMLTLIETAFDNGARQVVLDILVEGESARHPFDLEEDKQFADGLNRLLANPHFGQDKQLVLVRSLRHPLQQFVLDSDNGNTVVRQPYPALSEIRGSPLVDQVVDRSGGRIVLAAPYFMYSPDHILRDWELLKVVCLRTGLKEGGIVRVVPSVQLQVAARHLGLSAGQMPAQSNSRCTPYPRNALSHLRLKHEMLTLKEATERQEHDTSIRYWAAVRAAVANVSRTRAKPGIDIGDATFHRHDLSNRVIFRSGADLQSVPDFSEVPAHLLLFGGLDQEKLASVFSGRVVVIGQSFIEAGDVHDTPMGKMSGSAVLLNAIDSMTRYPVFKEPGTSWRLLLAFLIIVIVGFVFSRWNSAVGPAICVVLLLPALGVLSFYFFTYGVWLDFALPLVGILIHREYKSFEERAELRNAEHCRTKAP